MKPTRGNSTLRLGPLFVRVQMTPTPERHYELPVIAKSQTTNCFNQYMIKAGNTNA